MDGIIEFLKHEPQRTALNVLLIFAMLFITLKLVGLLCRVMTKKLVKIDRAEAAAYIPFLRYLLKGIAIFIFGAMMIGAIPPLSALMTSLLAGGGVVAVVVGIAAQDAIGNMLAGIMITVFKPFRVGDLVRYVSQDITGTIEEITLRHTVIRTFENKRVLIPNGTINKEIIENSDMGDTRILNSIEVGISYEADPQRALSLLREEVLGLASYADLRTGAEKANGAPEVILRVVEFGASAVNLKALFWSKNVAAGAAQKSDLFVAVKKRFEAEGIEIAYPQLVVTQK